MKAKLILAIVMMFIKLAAHSQSSLLERNREILHEMQKEIRQVVNEIQGNIGQMGFIEGITPDGQGTTIENNTTEEKLAISERNTDDYCPNVYPVSEEPRVSSGYGYRVDPFTGKKAFHAGIDLAVPEKTEVLSCGTGKVIKVSYNRTNGNYIIIDHENKYRSYYGHLSKVSVKYGDKVNKGQVIALSGNTGMSTGPHIHFQISYNGKTIDPLTIIN